MADLIYNDSFCAKATEFLSKGKSIAALAANFKVCRDTIYHWRDTHPEFKKAIKDGLDACQAYWEEIGEAGITGELKNFGGSPWIFMMKNRFREDYAEQKEQKSTNDSIVEQLLLGKKQTD